MKFASSLALALAATVSLATAQPAAAADDDDFAHVTFFSDKACEKVVRVAALRPNQCSAGSEEFASMMVDAAPKSGTISVFGDKACDSYDKVMTLGKGAHPMVEGKCVKIAEGNNGNNTTTTSTGPSSTASTAGTSTASTAGASNTNQPGTHSLAANKKDGKLNRRKSDSKPGAGKQEKNQGTGKLGAGKGKSVKFSS